MKFSEESKEVKKITMNQLKDMNNNQIVEMVNKYTVYIITGGLNILKLEEIKLQ